MKLNVSKFALKLALRYKWRLVFFASCIAIGIAFLFSVGNIVTTFSDGIATYARNLLTADIQLTSYRPFDNKVEKVLQELKTQKVETSKILLFVSMLQIEKENVSPIFVSVKAIEENYPLYGELEVEPKNYKDTFFQQNSCLIYKSIAKQRDVTIGDTVRIGMLKLKVAGIIKKAPAVLSNAITFAPRVIIPEKLVKKSGLIAFGSRIRYSYHMLLPKGKNNFSFVSELKKELQRKIQSPHVRITTYADAQERIRTIMKRQGSFFLLVSLVTLLVGAVGMGASMTTFLNEQLETVGTLRSLGLSPKEIFRLYFQLCSIIGIAGGFIGAGIGMLFSIIGYTIVGRILSLNIEIAATLHWKYFIEALSIAFVITICINFYKIRFLSKVSPMEILRGKVKEIQSSWIASFFTMFLLFSGLFCYTFYKASNLNMAIFFSIAIIGCIIGILILIFIILRMCSYIYYFFGGTSYSSFLIRNGMRQLVRQKARTFVFLLSLAIGFTLIKSLNLVYNSLTNEFQRALSSEAPNIFLVDVQKYQHKKITEIASKYMNRNIQFSPLIRARLVEINGERLTRKNKKLSSKEKRIRRWRTREQNLTYKDTLNRSEYIIRGKLWEKGENDPQVSIEEGFAKRANIQMGDTLVFDIGGREIDGHVTSMRKIDWISMRPNFFIVMPKNVLKKAPQTFIASLKIQEKNIESFQKAIIKNAPNIFFVNVNKIIKIVKNIIGYFLTTLKLTAYFCIIVGILILVGTLSIGHNERFDHVALLRTLGCSKKTIILIDVIEFLSVGIITAFISGVLSYALAYAVSQKMKIDIVLYSGVIFETAFIVALPLMIGLFVNWKTYGASVMQNIRREM